MCFSGLFAIGQIAGCSMSNYDNTDYIKVFYTIDGGGEIQALCFYPDIECNIPADVLNEPLYYDPNCDGDGGEGILLTNMLSEFTFNIAGTGSLIDLRIEVRMDAGSEEVALDYLRVRSDTETLGVNENNLENLVSFYPNPSDGLFELKVSNSTTLSHAIVYDLLGKHVKIFELENMSNQRTLDLTEMASGVYMISVNSQDGRSIVKKLIIN